MGRFDKIARWVAAGARGGLIVALRFVGICIGPDPRAPVLPARRGLGTAPADAAYGLVPRGRGGEGRASCR